jgi:hypothetical protein
MSLLISSVFTYDEDAGNFQAVGVIGCLPAIKASWLHMPLLTTTLGWWGMEVQARSGDNCGLKHYGFMGQRTASHTWNSPTNRSSHQSSELDISNQHQYLGVDE